MYFCTFVLLSIITLTVVSQSWIKTTYRHNIWLISFAGWCDMFESGRNRGTHREPMQTCRMVWFDLIWFDVRLSSTSRNLTDLPCGFLPWQYPTQAMPSWLLTSEGPQMCWPSLLPGSYAATPYKDTKDLTPLLHGSSPSVYPATTTGSGL